MYMPVIHMLLRTVTCMHALHIIFTVILTCLLPVLCPYCNVRVVLFGRKTACTCCDSVQFKGCGLMVWINSTVALRLLCLSCLFAVSGLGCFHSQWWLNNVCMKSEYVYIILWDILFNFLLWQKNRFCVTTCVPISEVYMYYSITGSW